MTNTIYALATPLGGAIAIIRISGKETRRILGSIFNGSISHGRLNHGQLVDEGVPFDDVMAVFFEGPNSYSGEDMAELHIHSSRAVATHTMEVLSALGGRPAAAGEFTRRAFLNGKIALSEAEAVMDLIGSTAQRSAQAAMLQLTGKLTEAVRSILEKITNILAEIDAMIDYPDEMEDRELNPEIAQVIGELDTLLAHGMRARHLREGFNIAIVGRPNVGKSSLLNALISEDRAIVTDVAGTTRDVIEAETIFYGLPVHIFDTAGLHHTEDVVERMGIDRAKNAIATADLIYALLDASCGITLEDEEMLRETAESSRIIIWNKMDMTESVPHSELENTAVISTVTGQGIEELKKRTAEIICPSDETGLLTNMRHIEALSNGKKLLADALNAEELDQKSQDLQMALHSLGLITGDAVDETVIDRIFQRFCVGK